MSKYNCRLLLNIFFYSQSKMRFTTTTCYLFLFFLLPVSLYLLMQYEMIYTRFSYSLNEPTLCTKTHASLWYYVFLCSACWPRFPFFLETTPLLFFCIATTQKVHVLMLRFMSYASPTTNHTFCFVFSFLHVPLCSICSLCTPYFLRHQLFHGVCCYSKPFCLSFM